MIFSTTISGVSTAADRLWFDCNKSDPRGFFHPSNGIQVGSLVRDSRSGSVVRVTEVDRARRRFAAEDVAR